MNPLRETATTMTGPSVTSRLLAAAGVAHDESPPPPPPHRHRLPAPPRGEMRRQRERRRRPAPRRGTARGRSVAHSQSRRALEPAVASLGACERRGDVPHEQCRPWPLPPGRRGSPPDGRPQFNRTRFQVHELGPVVDPLHEEPKPRPRILRERDLQLAQLALRFRQGTRTNIRFDYSSRRRLEPAPNRRFVVNGYRVSRC
jgi:hypothetical protein